jgi:hypothetical protein
MRSCGQPLTSPRRPEVCADESLDADTEAILSAGSVPPIIIDSPKRLGANLSR